MKIVIVGPGIMPIPPTGWGAVEILIWDYKCELEKLGHQVLLVNTQNRNEIINQCNSFNADFVHIQYDDYYPVINSLTCPKIAITSHFGYLEQTFESGWGSGYQHIFNGFRTILHKAYIFCLSEGIRNYYIKHGFPADRLQIAPNGARPDLFAFQEHCIFPDRSLFLAKIDYRKRQEKFRHYDSNIYFAGNIADPSFVRDRFYLGEWNKEYLYNHLTDYANLVLLSDGEADPLVTKEALTAGLGLVVSQYAAANLDTDLPFIDVIEEEAINDIPYVKCVIEENRKRSVTMRNQIKAYAQTQSWSYLVPRYVNIIESLA